MTKKELKEIIRVCGENFEELDIPTYIRNRDKAKARAFSMQEEEWIQEEREKKEREKFEGLGE